MVQTITKITTKVSSKTPQFIAMPSDKSVLMLMGKTAMDKNSYGRHIWFWMEV